MRSVLAIAGSVAADAVRRRIVYVVFFFALVFAAMAPQLPSYGMGVEVAVYREVTLAVVFVASLVVTVVLGATRIPAEIDRRTVYNVLAKPVRRWEYLLGTWMGISATLAWVVAAFCLIAILVGAVVYQQWMWVLWQGAVGIWLEMVVLTAFGMAAAARLGSVPVVLATLTFLFAAHARDSLFAPSDLGYRLYPSLDALNVIAPVAHGSGIPLVYLGSMIAVASAYSAALLVIAGALFSGRDL